MKRAVRLGLALAATLALTGGAFAAGGVAWRDITPSEASPASGDSYETEVVARTSVASAKEPSTLANASGFGWSNLSRLLTEALKPLWLILR